MDFTSITNSWGYILSGAAYTIQLTAITAVGGLFLGTLLAPKNAGSPLPQSSTSIRCEPCPWCLCFSGTSF